LNTSEDIVRMLRAQAWQRAKAELRSVAETFCGHSSAVQGQFTKYSTAVDNFIREVEDEGLSE